MIYVRLRCYLVKIFTETKTTAIMIVTLKSIPIVLSIGRLRKYHKLENHSTTQRKLYLKLKPIHDVITPKIILKAIRRLKKKE